MKTIKTLTVIIVSFFLLNFQSASAEFKYEPKLKLNNSQDRSSEIKTGTSRKLKNIIRREPENFSAHL
ncbi:MAG: hypothetical protein IPM96_19590 [Ignavibacteria bacterium]|nr:hypothetical protein [Ignavibacteria bacterium]